MKRCAEWIAVALLLAACSGPAPRQYAAAASPRAAQAVHPAPAVADSTKGDPQQRFQEALQLMKDHKQDEAKAAFASLAQDFPQYAGPLNDLGILQAQGRQREQAIASFARAAAADDRNAFAWNWLGILYRESGDYAHAEQSYRKAIAVKPDEAAAHLNLGILYDVYLGRPAEALAQYREYQRIAGSGNLMVGVWIRQLETRLRPTSLAATSTVGAMP